GGQVPFVPVRGGRGAGRKQHGPRGVRRRGGRPLPELRADRAAALRRGRHLQRARAALRARMRPLIGITTYVEPARWGYWELEAALIPQAYVDSVESAGGRAWLVPPSDDGVEETLDALDGMVFTGGADIEPAQYGEEPHPETFGIRRDRDASELALMQAALDRDMPVLGICRGIQV